MAANLLSLDSKTLTTPNPLSFSLPKTLSSSLPFPSSSSSSSLLIKSKLITTSTNPPSSKEEAIQQAKTCLITTLQKPLNNLKLSTSFKLNKKLKQPRFRVEIPVADTSSDSLSQLALLFFSDIPLTRKGGPPINLILLYPDAASAQSGSNAFMSSKTTTKILIVQHLDVGSVLSNDFSNGVSKFADVAVFLAPELSDATAMKTVAEEIMYPRPVVMFNPKWGFDEEEGLDDELGGFVGSFEVVYSFMGLEVKGILSKRNGVVFKCVMRDGSVRGGGSEKWGVFVEEEEGEGLRVVSTFKTRPSVADVEYVLYNLMAMNSPVTKSVKFLRDLVSNVTGGKK